jgi:type IV secretion system protein VirB10
MTDEAQNEPQEQPADRDVPSVAITPRNQKLLIAGFLTLAGLAMILVVISGMDKSAPKSLVQPKEVTFKTPGNPTPYIKTDEPEKASGAPVSADTIAAQKELAMQQEAFRMAQAQQKKLEQRAMSPQLIFDRQDNQAYAAGQPAAVQKTAYAVPANAPPLPPGGGQGAGGLLSGGGSEDGNAAFAAQNANKEFETAEASQMQNLQSLIPQGTLISGILETAIQSDLPGMVRAIVSENIYSFDGTHLLIPQGSALVGQYRSGIVRGQSRVFVIWNRMIRHDGVTINIGSSGTDELGRSGLEGDVDTHFFERFGSSVLLSMIDTGLQVVAENANNRNSATVALNTGEDFSKSAEIALQNSIAIPPTINIDQGTRIKVFVGKDLDFSHVQGNQLAD